MAQRKTQQELEHRMQRGASVIVHRKSVLGVTARQERLDRRCPCHHTSCELHNGNNEENTAGGRSIHPACRKQWIARAERPSLCERVRLTWARSRLELGSLVNAHSYAFDGLVAMQIKKGRNLALLKLHVTYFAAPDI